jgi:hypothetical protein
VTICPFEFGLIFSLLPTASVSTAIYVEHLSGHLACVYQVEDSVDNVFYSHDLAHGLQRPKMLLGSILVQRGIDGAREPPR